MHESELHPWCVLGTAPYFFHRFWRYCLPGSRFFTYSYVFIMVLSEIITSRYSRSVSSRYSCCNRYSSSQMVEGITWQERDTLFNKKRVRFKFYNTLTFFTENEIIEWFIGCFWRLMSDMGILPIWRVSFHWIKKCILRLRRIWHSTTFVVWVFLLEHSFFMQC